MDTFNDLKSFIADVWPVNDGDIKRTTLLEEDLKITGDDAAEFIIAYSKRFNVNIDNFNIDKYFDFEGDKLFLCIVRLFNKKRRERSLTVYDLEKGVLHKQLDDEIINNR